MKFRKLSVWTAFILVLLLLGVAAGIGGSRLLARWPASVTGADAAAIESGAEAGLATAQTSAGGQDPLIFSYAAKFVCQEPLQPGQISFDAVAPLVQEQTDVLIHNPNAYSVVFYKKAVRAPLEDTPAIAPGAWKELKLDPDYAVRVNCDDIAKLLTGNPAATFIGAYGIGVKVEGFVVIGIGPQTVNNQTRYGPLDVTAEYSRGSEVLKKDINYQPWWWWWWWDLPWRLGYPYERIVTVDPAANIDCRDLLYDELERDAQDPQKIPDPQQQAETFKALQEGRTLDPTNLPQEESLPALVALIGRCEKLATTPVTASIDYVLLSNKAPTDANPITGGGGAAIRYPWIPGRWYDLTVVIPQNMSIDLDQYIRDWQTQRWLDAGLDDATIQNAMGYFFPWWCGWGYYYWWWWGDDCTDIGVGEGESLDVEQVIPTRVFMAVWPPQ